MSAKTVGMEDSVLKARIEDAVRLCESRYYPHFVGFLDERQAAVARRHALQAGFSNFRLWGGYEEAQRAVFGAFPEGWEPDYEAYPLLPLFITFRQEDSLSHRDFLGTLMAQGITRDTIGDILAGEGRCVIFVKEEMASYITAQVTKVGGAGIVFCEEPYELPASKGFEEKTGTVASARLDCVAAALLGISREKATALITSGSVSLSYTAEESVSAKVSDGDIVSAKGFGKYVVDQIGPPTKKGRLRLIARKYR